MRTASGVTTVSFAGIWEQTTSGVRTLYYFFNGDTVALRTSAGVQYLQGDHLGSMTWAFNSSGVQTYGEEYGPWGRVRAGSMGTTLSYTGQRLDATGLLYYHARYYHPVLARFISADSIVPGQSDTAGTANPQNLNRYAYVNNNPIKNTDPTGHCGLGDCALEGALIGTAIEPGGGTAIGAAIGGILDIATIVIGVVLVKDSVDALAATTAPDAPDAGSSTVPADVNVFLGKGGVITTRPDIDYETDENGMVIPQEGPLPKGKSSVADVNQVSLTGKYVKIPAGTVLPEGVGVVADGNDVNPASDLPATHHTFYPKRSMTPDEFNDKLNQIT